MCSLHPPDAEHKGFGHGPTSILNLIFRNQIQKLQVGTSLHCLRKLAILALLQFPDDFSEQHLILRQCSAVKDVLIQWDAVIGQNVLYIIASEMNHLIVGQFSRTDQKAFQHGCKGDAHALSGSAPTSGVQGSSPGASKSAASAPLWLFRYGGRQGQFGVGSWHHAPLQNKKPNNQICFATGCLARKSVYGFGGLIKQ